MHLYQGFKWRVIANLDRGTWTITEADVRTVIDEIRAEREAV
jgi:hypothetical protein